MEKDDLKRLRKKFGLTQTEAAKQVGVTLRSWQYYESGERSLRTSLYELFIIKNKSKLVDKF